MEKPPTRSESRSPLISHLGRTTLPCETPPSESSSGPTPPEGPGGAGYGSASAQAFSETIAIGTRCGGATVQCRRRTTDWAGVEPSLLGWRWHVTDQELRVDWLAPSVVYADFCWHVAEARHSTQMLHGTADQVRGGLGVNVGYIPGN